MRRNFISMTEFILLGLTRRLELQILFFVLFLSIYLITLAGNLGMMVLIQLNARLHTPTYYFLSHWSFVDLCFSSNVTPKIQENLLSKRQTISYPACLVQCYFFIALVHVEIYILSLMAFDRYMAICNPLLYGSKMSKSVCRCLITLPYVYGVFTGLMETMWTTNWRSVGTMKSITSTVLTHPLIKLACSDTHHKELWWVSVFVVTGLNLSLSLLIILTSYLCIFPAVLKISSTESKRKAFSTCGSHLTVAIIFYATLFFMYLRPPSKESVEQGKMVAIFYITLIPMLNPMIYSLWNKDVKEAISKELSKRNIVC